MDGFWRKQLYIRVGNLCFSASMAVALQTLAATSILVMGAVYFYSEQAALRITHAASAEAAGAAAIGPAASIADTPAALTQCGRRGGDWNYGGGTCTIHSPLGTALSFSPPADRGMRPLVIAKSQQPPASSRSAADTARSSGDASALRTHGDALLAARYLTAARLFYRQAADAGDGRAALQLGATYDPSFLARAGMVRARSDAARAARWYRRARQLHAAGAQILLKALATDTDHAAPQIQN